MLVVTLFAAICVCSFILYSSRFYNNMLIVVISVERYVAVCYPMLAAAYAQRVNLWLVSALFRLSIMSTFNTEDL